MYAIKTKGLKKQYKHGLLALQDMNIEVKQGEIFTLLGKNGAGKSTLIKILTTYLQPDEGSAVILGKDVIKEAAAIRSRIACVAQQISIDMHLSLKENMMFQSKLYHIPKKESFKRMKRLIETMGLEAYADYPPASYSGGMKRRLDIALNMMSNPEILFLDEPTAGMDVTSRNAMWDMIMKIQSHFHTTIFLTTHDLTEAERLSDTICIIKDGKEMIQGTPYELKDYMKQQSLCLSFPTEETAQKQMKQISMLYPHNRISLNKECMIIHSLSSDFDFSQCMHSLLEMKLPLTGAQLIQPSLEDVFIDITQKNLEEQL